MFSDCDPDTLINNTLTIAQKCNVTLTTDQYFLPEYQFPRNMILILFCLSCLNSIAAIIKSYSKRKINLSKTTRL